MQEIEIKHWHDFEVEIQSVNRRREQRETEAERRLNDPLFRGLGNRKWGLQTTLERSYPQERSDETLSFRKYYWKAAGSKPAVETLSGKRWDAVPNFGEFERKLEGNKHGWLDHFLN